MLLSELSQVNEIDSRINQIHGELTQLYKQRADLLGMVAQTPVNPITKPLKPGELAKQWAQAEYDRLSDIWHAYNITLPSYRSLKPYILQGHNIIQALTKARPEWHDAFTLVFIPSAKHLDFPIPSQLRRMQSFTNGADHVDSSLPATSPDKKWRLLVVFSDEEGLYSGSLEMMLDAKEQIVAGYNLAGLGLREYAAFSLQQPHPIDVGTWTVLPKDRTDSEHVPCAGFADGQFRFVTDEINSVFGDNRFRPTVEIQV